MKFEETVRRVNEIINQYDFALTLRQIYYRLVAAGVIPNQRSAYNGLSAQLVKAREQGLVDASRIVDRSRRVDDNAFDSPQSFLQAVRDTVDSNFMSRHWTSQERHVEIWVEKDALSSVIGQAVEDMNVIVAPSRGYSSFSYVRDAVYRFRRLAPKRKVKILHFADHDPSGLDMTRDLRVRLESYSNCEVVVERIALSFDQVQQYNLIPNPAKITDPRAQGYIDQYGDDCWELDAIEPDELVRIVQETVNAQITDEQAWAKAKNQDDRYRDKLRDAIDELQDSFDTEDEEGDDDDK